MLPRQRMSHNAYGWALVIFAVLLGLLAALAPAELFAQTIPVTATVAVTPPWWMSYVQPLIEAAIGAAAIAIAGLAVKAYGWLATKAGIDLDEKHESALRNTVASAAKALIMELITRAAGGKLRLDIADLVAKADYVSQAVPDAIEHFGKNRAQVVEMVKGALPDAMMAAGVSADLEDAGVIASQHLLAIGEPLQADPLNPMGHPAAPGGAGGAL